MFNIRQHFFDNKKYLSYPEVNSALSKAKNVDYYALPAKVSQQTLKMADQNFKSFFSLKRKAVKEGKDSKAKIPNYLDKDGYYVVTYTNQAISKVQLKKDIVALSGTKIQISSKQKDIRQVRLLTKGNHCVVEILYNVAEKPLKDKNNRIAGIDIGMNNIATVGSNVMRSFIINGRPISAINQFYAKQMSYYTSKLKKRQNTSKPSKQIQRLLLKRNNKLKDYLHKSSLFIANQLDSNNIDTLIIGKNVGWKQEVKLGSRTNQKFVMSPSAKLIALITYKCNLKGIEVICNEESYTSKCSFLDNEDVKKHETYLGKRIHRGLFKSSHGKFINADLNGALNIIKKAVPKAFVDMNVEGIEAIVVAPVKHTIKFTNKK